MSSPNSTPHANRTISQPLGSELLPPVNLKLARKDTQATHPFSYSANLLDPDVSDWDDDDELYSIPASSDFETLEYPPYGDHKRTSLIDIVQSPLSPHPQFYIPNDPPNPDLVDDYGRPRALNSTKSITSTAVDYDPELTIEFVVFAPDMLDSFINEAKKELNKIFFSWSDPDHQVTMAHVDPRSTQAHLPPYIHCEGDTVIWTWNSILLPCSAILEIVKYGQVTSSSLAHRPKNRECPFWTVGDQNASEKVLPDAVFITRREDHTDKDIPLVVEVKCDNVLRLRQQENVQDKRRSCWRSMWSTITSSCLRDPEFKIGNALPFKWPFATPDSKNDILTRVIVQVC